VNETTQVLHVVVGVIKNSHGQVLIARRPLHAHQGGLWEFPGGKLETGETPGQALQRELHEELAIHVDSFAPLGKVRHNYPDKSVLLDVYMIHRFMGEAYGREGQPIQWVSPEQLSQYSFPAANLEIINMLKLPELCLITGAFSSPADFITKLEASLARGIRLVQLRLKEVDRQTQLELARQALALCRQYQALLLLAPSLGDAYGRDVAGMHLTSRQLFEFSQRPLAKNKLLSVSVHNHAELQQAKSLQADFVLLSPVMPTSSHPDAEPLGWNDFAKLAEETACPVFALGGVDESHLAQARRCGAFGIAAISAFWGQAK